MQENPTPEPDRDQLIAEATMIQRAKLAATRAMQTTSMSPVDSDGRVGDWQPINLSVARVQRRIEEIRSQQRAERESRIVAFLAEGGDCPECFDQGPCESCARGLAVIDDGIEHDRRDWVASTGLPRRFQSCTFASFPGDRRLGDDVARFVDSWDGRQSMILGGRYGVGKTGLLAASVNALSPDWHTTNHSMLFRTTPKLFDELRAGFDDGSFAALLRRCQNVTLLILDDLGAEKPTDWVLERLYAIVNHRYEHEMPIWATTNLTVPQLTAAIGERVWSRLQEGAFMLAATGRNLREQ